MSVELERSVLDVLLRYRGNTLDEEVGSKLHKDIVQVVRRYASIVAEKVVIKPVDDIDRTDAAMLIAGPLEVMLPRGRSSFR